MKKIILTLIILASIGALPALAQNDAKAKKILDAVSNKMKHLKTVRANFSLRLSGAGGKVNEVKKGSFVMEGHQYHANLGAQEIICDGKTVWTYSPDTKEVQVSNYNPSEQTLSPDKLFTSTYDKDYIYTYKGEQRSDGKLCNVIELTPIDKSKQFSKIDLYTDKKENIIVSGHIWEKNGNKYEYSVSNFTPNARVSPGEFTWNKSAHPGVDVVDLR